MQKGIAMQVLHHGFDTIAVAIRSQIPDDLRKFLDEHREVAENRRNPVEITYQGHTFHLEGHGGKGYRYILKGGPLGATWFFKKPNSADSWGVRVSVGSTFLATQGLGAARAHITDTLEALGFEYTAEDVSISRADVCTDILAPDFRLQPHQFVMHSSAKRHDRSLEYMLSSVGRSSKQTSVTVGAVRGRQAIIYDKRREVLDTNKTIWWEIWNRNLEKMGLPPLDLKDPKKSAVWRVEIRAGKDLLKGRWKIRTWAEFDKKFGDLVSEAFQSIQYCHENFHDSNRSRWKPHPIWARAWEAIQSEIEEMRSFVKPDKVRYVYREEQIRIIRNLVGGNVISLAALNRKSESELKDFMRSEFRQIADEVIGDLARAEKKLAEAKERYVFM